MASDKELATRINANRETKAKYERVRNAISLHGLNETVDLSHYKDYIQHCKELVSKADSDDGYHYLSTYKDKLGKKKAVMEEYVNFVSDANQSFQDLYVLLGQKIASLDSSISSDLAAYNKGKSFFDQLR